MSGEKKPAEEVAAKIMEHPAFSYFVEIIHKGIDAQTAPLQSELSALRKELERYREGLDSKERLINAMTIELKNANEEKDRLQGLFDGQAKLLQLCNDIGNHPQEIASLRSQLEKAMQCAQCKGEGEICNPNAIPDSEPWETCLCCKGSGLMPTPAEIIEREQKMIDHSCDLEGKNLELKEQLEKASEEVSKFREIFLKEHSKTCVHHTDRDREVGCPVCLNRKLEKAQEVLKPFAAIAEMFSGLPPSTPGCLKLTKELPITLGDCRKAKEFLEAHGKE